MTKAEVLTRVNRNTGIEKLLVQKSIESFLEVVKNSLSSGEPVFVRGFGSIVLKKRARKLARNIRKNTAIMVPEHYIVALKPCKDFADEVKKLKVKE
jgi:DNA-binding protein HU-beta